ncbi:uncharacterized protein K452DRAFT_193887, partial [Aplosporella prunicola CBS 121167]
PHINKPRILCLHGEGCSAAIFRAQSRQLTMALAREFDFVFVDAPFPSTAGPGVLPVYEGPYYAWLNRPPQPTDMAVVRARIADMVALEGPFAGVMAFSQGGRLATSLLLQECRGMQRRRGRDTDQVPLVFGVLLSSTYPPLGYGDEAAEEQQRIDEDLDEDVDENGTHLMPKSFGPPSSLVTVPSVHVHGRRDPWRPANKQILTRCYDARTATLVEFVGGHHCPRAAADV